MSVSYTPSAAQASYPNYTGVTLADPGASAYSAPSPTRIDARYVLNPIMCEIMAIEAALQTLQQSSVDLKVMYTRGLAGAIASQNVYNWQSFH